jgi:hypothetical protein
MAYPLSLKGDLGHDGAAAPAPIIDGLPDASTCWDATRHFHFALTTSSDRAGTPTTLAETVSRSSRGAPPRVRSGHARDVSARAEREADRGPGGRPREARRQPREKSAEGERAGDERVVDLVGVLRGVECDVVVLGVERRARPRGSRAADPDRPGPRGGQGRSVPDGARPRPDDAQAPHRCADVDRIGTSLLATHLHLVAFG